MTSDTSRLNGKNKTNDGVEGSNPATSTEASDVGESEALPAHNSDASTGSNPSPGRDSEDLRQQNVRAPANTEVDRDRLPNGKWPPGVSGNPKGRKPKNRFNDLDVPSALERALDKKVKVKRGEKILRVTKRDAMLEQWINQAVNGDHRARRELNAYADKHRIDLFAGQHTAIRKGIAEAAGSSSALTLTEEVLDRLSQTILDEIIRVMNELEAEKKKTLH